MIRASDPPTKWRRDRRFKVVVLSIAIRVIPFVDFRVYGPTQQPSRFDPKRIISDELIWIKSNFRDDN
jgi:hypothetical protein